VLRKKQVIMIVSIAVISFLIGTTFNSMTMAEDDDRGNPHVWEAIHELQSKVDGLNSSLVELQSELATIEDEIQELDSYHRYSVESVVDIGDASVGNTSPVTVYVHVTFHGLPYYTTSSDNFHAHMVECPLASGTLSFGMVDYHEAVYTFLVVPFAPEHWVSGFYVGIIGVRNPAPPASSIYHAETMFSFTL